MQLPATKRGLSMWLASAGCDFEVLDEDDEDEALIFLWSYLCAHDQHLRLVE